MYFLIVGSITLAGLEDVQILQLSMWCFNGVKNEQIVN